LSLLRLRALLPDWVTTISSHPFSVAKLLILIAGIILGVFSLFGIGKHRTECQRLDGNNRHAFGRLDGAPGLGDASARFSKLLMAGGVCWSAV